MYLRLKPLKSGRHLGSGGGLGMVPFKEIKSSLCSYRFQIRSVGKKSEPLVWRIQTSEEIRIQDSVQFTSNHHPQSPEAGDPMGPRATGARSTPNIDSQVPSQVARDPLAA